MLALSVRLRPPAMLGLFFLLAAAVATSRTCEDPSCQRPTQRVQRIFRRRSGNARPSQDDGDAQVSFVPPGKQTVLIVDDDEMVRKVHTRFVERLGYGVETASDGVEALTKLALGIDLVLLDLYMPNMDGFEVTKRIREHPTHGLVPIIVITGSDKEVWYPRALEVGANDVLGKPINLDELRLRTRWLMELKAAHDQARASNQWLSESIAKATDNLRNAVQRATDSERRTHRAHLDTIRRLTIAAEYRDETVAGHLARVGLAAGLLARAAGLAGSQAETIQHAAPLHDVGMIGIPDAVLLKEGPLDDMELALVREHTYIGASLLAGSESEVIQMGATIALRHHERWDGTGYPDGVAGHDIPIEARICSIVDFYDASTMNRPYRPARPHDDVIAEMKKEEAGQRFDPILLEAFFATLPEIRAIRREFPIT
jgi:putative two-component system response regulator